MSDSTVVLSNAGPLIVLGKLNRLEILADLFGEVRIPRRVYDEVITQGMARGALEALIVRLFWQRHAWPVVNIPADVLSAYTPSVRLDRGETEVLAFARTLKDALVLLDDEVARAEARRLGLSIRGTLGILVQAYRAQLLSFAESELLIREIAARPDIWISAKLCERVLASLGEQRGSQGEPERVTDWSLGD